MICPNAQPRVLLYTWCIVATVWEIVFLPDPSQAPRGLHAPRTCPGPRSILFPLLKSGKRKCGRARVGELIGRRRKPLFFILRVFSACLGAYKRGKEMMVAWRSIYTSHYSPTKLVVFTLLHPPLQASSLWNIKHSKMCRVKNGDNIQL